ncbi:MAG TPA: class I SAM-dependent methyltransferase [Acidimicrobiia bacterium]|nr:class I SAM-dependent methyltransferase [Acidimicrobiia bacterium]
MDEALLAEQQAYYCARAEEYDDWWYRRGEYELGPETNAAWDRDKAELVAAFDSFAPRGDVLELAGGTGIWTGELLRFADRVTVVDASAETLAINRAKHGDERVDRIVADLFSFTPPRRFDVVFFSFWISHVPAQRWSDFWSVVANAVAPGGRVFFLDGARPERGLASGPAEWREKKGAELAALQGGSVGSDITERELRDGRRFRVVKRFWEPAVLEAELAALGWNARARETSWQFIYGEATRSR